MERSQRVRCVRVGKDGSLWLRAEWLDERICSVRHFLKHNCQYFLFSDRE